MRIFSIRQPISLIPTLAVCVMAITMATAAPPDPKIPHRRPSLPPAQAKHTPYAAIPSEAAIAGKAAHTYRPLHLAAATATKKWAHAGWMATGGIERRHFWLTHPIDAFWRRHLFFLLRERFFWWHHRHLYYVWWLGQGWEYRHGATTQTSTPSAQNAFAEGLDGIRPSDLALRVRALAVLNGLQLTGDQFGLLQSALAQMSDAGDVVDAEVIDNILDSHLDCLNTLGELYKNYIDSDDENIIDYRNRLAVLEDRHQFSVDPTIVVTDAARSQAGQIFERLSSNQIASYVADRAQAAPDVAEIIMAGLDQGRQIADSDFDDYSRCLGQRVAVLTIGLDSSADQPVIDQVTDLLSRARNLSDQDFAARRTIFQSRAEEIEKRCDPIDLINHAIQWDIANFLANPQAKGMAALRARQLQAAP